jgi:hypothetical protein
MVVKLNLGNRLDLYIIAVVEHCYTSGHLQLTQA